MASTFSSRVLSHPLVGAPESAAGADPKRTRVLKALTVVNTLAPLDMLVESEMEARTADLHAQAAGKREEALRVDRAHAFGVVPVEGEPHARSGHPDE